MNEQEKVLREAREFIRARMPFSVGSPTHQAWADMLAKIDAALAAPAQAVEPKDERAAFEAWAIHTKRGYRTDQHGFYFWSVGDKYPAWEGWQARAALAAAPQPAAPSLTTEQTFDVGEQRAGIGATTKQSGE